MKILPESRQRLQKSSTPNPPHGRGGLVAAVSQAELKATAGSGRTLALAHCSRVQMSFAHVQWITIILCKFCEFHLQFTPRTLFKKVLEV